MPRKRLITKPTEPSKTKNEHTFLNRNQNMKYESNQQLADLQVECLNKDKTIQEHERHIEEMKEDVRKLEAEIEKLHKKQNEMEVQHTEDIEAMVNTIFPNRRVIYYLPMSILLCFLICRLNCNKK